MTTSSNTNPISQTELEKAIEEANQYLERNWLLPCSVATHLINASQNTAKQLSALEAKCAEKDEALSDLIKWSRAVRYSMDTERPFPSRDKLSERIVQAEQAIANTSCGQNYIHKDKVREIVNVVVYISNLREDAHTLHHAQHLADEALQLAKAEGLIE